MRVKCVNSKTNITKDGCFRGLKEGNEYEVVDGTEKNVIIIDDEGDEVEYPKYRFRIIKEDKMENRIVRKLEDLNALENGMGLRILACDVSDREEYKNINITVLRENWRIAEILGPIEIKVKTLKAMGFKFEYKPLRTVEEVLEEMKANSLNPYCDNLFVVRCELNYEKNKSIYSVFKNIYSVTLGAYVFSEETAQKYADELNEIVGGK